MSMFFLNIIILISCISVLTLGALWLSGQDF
ncbi:Uncharacterised protein [Neisseria animaloris]|uniref:Uncharacterized protein n=1 Tax=Neisseria animaloris TaxID=326522 RepID=A0A3S4YGD5_9NEIS|nr:Uncharacterised protein [Neisseria animaloris]